MSFFAWSLKTVVGLRSRKEQYWEFVVGSVSDLSTRLVNGGDSFSTELGVRFELFEQLGVLAHLVASTERVAPNDWAFKVGLADMPDYLRYLEETALYAFYNRFGVTLGSGRPASILRSSCCSRLVRS